MRNPRNSLRVCKACSRVVRTGYGEKYEKIHCKPGENGEVNDNKLTSKRDKSETNLLDEAKEIHHEVDSSDEVMHVEMSDQGFFYKWSGKRDIR